MKLNMGCGKDILRGYINLDLRPLPGIDVSHDLNLFVYPFKDNTFSEIYCNNILEHLDDIVHIMEEMHRIEKPKCHIIIRAPHFSSQYAFMDPTHKHYFGHESFDYFLEDTQGRFPDFIPMPNSALSVDARGSGRVPSEGHAHRWYTMCYYNVTEIQGYDFLLWAGALGGWLPYFLAASLLLTVLDFFFTLIFYLTRAGRL